MALQREREETKECLVSEVRMLQGQIDQTATDMLDVLKKERADRERYGSLHCCTVMNCTALL